MRAIPWLLLCSLSACALPEEDASESMARAWCKKDRHCDRGDFESTWGSLDACVQDVTAFLDDVAAFYELLGCEYDPQAGYRARADIRGADCAEFEDGDAIEEQDVFVCD